jgi:hypothetical protein
MPQITYTGQQGSKYVEATSRYSYSNVIRYNGNTAFTIYRRKKSSFVPTDKYYDITKEVEYRPDKVARIFYGTPTYWWKIMEMNGMKDILEFKAGVVIRLPGGFLM